MGRRMLQRQMSLPVQRRWLLLVPHSRHTATRSLRPVQRRWLLLVPQSRQTATRTLRPVQRRWLLPVPQSHQTATRPPLLRLRRHLFLQRGLLLPQAP